MLTRGSWLASATGALALTNSAATTPEIPYSEASGGMYRIKASETMVTITWYASEEIGGTFVAAYDEDGVAVTQTVVHTRAYPIPAALFGAASIKAVADAAGTVYMRLKG